MECRQPAGSVVLRVHHYGFATESLERTAEVFRLLGYHVTEPVFDSIQRVRLCFAKRKGQCPVELVCDCGAEGPTNGYISKIGSGFYHICYEVDDMEECIRTLRRRQFLLKQKPVKAIAFRGRRVAWLYNRDVGLVELLEKDRMVETGPRRRRLDGSS